MMFNYFHDGTCQVVIHTANLLRIDWEQKTEALWLSPVLKRVKQETQVSSDNNHFGARFKADILQYIRAYHNASLQSLIDELNKFDFSPVRAIFIGSVPGYYGLSDTHFGLQKLRRSLRNATFEAQISDSTIAQVSSLGNLGKSFYAEFQNALNTAPSPKTQAKTKTVSSHFRLIFPTRRNFQNSINGLISGLSLFFNRSTSSGTRQLELSMPHLHSWHASRALRDDVMPHVKTYARVNGDDIRWILVTSSNLSKAAWGGVERGKVKIKSYEAGVLLIPDLFMASSDQAVSIKGSYGRDDQHTGKGIVNISMCYNLDLKKYAASDWIWSTAEAAEILSR